MVTKHTIMSYLIAYRQHTLALERLKEAQQAFERATAERNIAEIDLKAAAGAHTETWMFDRHIILIMDGRVDVLTCDHLTEALKEPLPILH